MANASIASPSARDRELSSGSLAYRPDVDGLRAFSILAVILFHVFPKRLPGGFAGVDIFFVISGYLISGIPLRNLDTGSFSYLNFYRRRIQRIFAALIVVLAAALAAGWLFLFQDEWRQLGKHVFAGAGFASNLALLRERKGYFDSPDKPLVNLWSLGIEEQFYILWPLLLAFAWKRRAGVLPFLLLVFAGSFALNLGFLDAHPAAAFYFPAMRFWELALGAVLAYATQSGARAARFLDRTWVAALCSLGGLLLLAASMLLLDRDRAFPGWWALLPTLAATLLIAAGPKAWLNRWALASPPAVILGLISYPLYLWHWPLLIFVKLVAPFSSYRLRYQAGTILAAVALAWLTWRFVERPLRRHPSRMVPWSLGLAMAALGLLGLASYRHIPARLTQADLRILPAAEDWNFPFSNYSREQFRAGTLGTGPEKVLFAGDSHMEQYFARVQFLMDGPLGRSVTAVFATDEGCPPLPGMTRIISHHPCDKAFEFEMRQAQDPRVRSVVLGAFWESYFGYAPGGDKRTSLRRTGDWSPFRGPGLETADYAFAGLGRTIRSLRAQGKRVFVILSNPTSSRFDPRLMVSRFTGRIDVQNVEREAVEGIRPIVDRLSATALESGAVTIDPFPYFCGKAVCQATDDRGQPMYIDENHLRGSWVREHATFIDQVFK